MYDDPSSFGEDSSKRGRRRRGRGKGKGQGRGRRQRGWRDRDAEGGDGDGVEVELDDDGGRRGRREPRKPRPLSEGKITRIAPQKRNPDRVSVYIDGKFAWGTSQDLMLSFSLHVDQVLTVERQQEILEATERARAKSIALEYLSYRMRSEHEVYDKLIGKEFDPKIAAETVARFRELGYLNDARFTEAYVRERLVVGRYGPRRIRMDLKKRGIAPDLAQNALEALEEAAIAEAAETVLTPKWKRLSRDHAGAPRIARKKAYDFLSRRGFSGPTVRAALEAQPPIEVPESEDGTPAPPEFDPDKALDLGRKRWSRLTRQEPNDYKRRSKLYDHLRRKGVPSDLIRTVADTLKAEDEAAEEAARAAAPDPNAYDDAQEEAEFAELIELAQRKWARLERSERDTRKRRKKLQDFLMRRGHRYATIRRLWDEEHLE